MRDNELPDALRDFPERPIEESSPSVGDICAQYGLGPRDTLTVYTAHELILERVAPLITWVAAHMLRDLRTQVARDPSAKIVFVGRDGHVFAAAVRALDPELFARHGVEVRLSRNVMEALWMETLRREALLQVPPGERLSLDEKTFRTFKGMVSAETAAGAVEHTHNYLGERGLPVDSQGAAVILVDDGLRGGGGEVLRHVFGWDTFTHLTVAAVPPKHPRPESIQGHLIHLGRDKWEGGTLRYLPDDPSLTLMCNQALHLWETFISGPQHTVVAMRPNGPVSGTLPVWRGARVPEQWRNTNALQAMRASVLLAAHTHAAAERGRRVPLDRIMRDQEKGRDLFVSDLRRVVRGDRSVDATFRDMMWTTAQRQHVLTETQHRALVGVERSFPRFVDPAHRVTALARRGHGIPAVTSPTAGFLRTGDTCTSCPDVAAPGKNLVLGR